MAEPKLDFMTVDAFLDWATRQEERYELVDGLPRMMAGARAKHDRIVVTALGVLGRLLQGGPCEPFSGDFAVLVPRGNVRRPDVTIDCGGTDDDRLHAANPVVVVEVLSPSTRGFDLVRKFAEYRSIPSVRHILYVEPDEMAAILHTRGEDGRWEDVVIQGPDAEIPLPGIGITLRLAEFYPSGA